MQEAPAIVVAYRVREGVVCAHPLCLAAHGREMAANAQPMTQLDLDCERVRREGMPVVCVSCGDFIG